jgi:serine/threonine protein kinase
MASEFHRRMRQIFDQALERPEAEREAYVKSASAGDAALEDAVKELLRARSASDSFLDATLPHTSQIGRYLIRGELGRGAMGIVYDAIDPMIGRRVAVKVISLSAGTDPAEAEFLKERLFREARSAGRLFHPGIIVILDVGMHEDSAFITMEHVDGPSLQRVLATGPLEPKTALGILQQTAAALDYAHQHSVVHRDIKPANIMLQGGNTVKVADFGIAKVISQDATLTGVLMGTPSYMSPEQIEAQPVDGRSDQFSLAVLAYELFTGARPFEADSMATVAHLIVYGPRPSAHSVKPSLPAALDEVLARGLNRFPEQRYSSCAEFAAALEKALLADAALPVQKLPIAKRGIPIGYFAGGAVLLVLAVAAIYFRSAVTGRRAAVASSAPIAHQPAPAKPTPLGPASARPVEAVQHLEKPASDKSPDKSEDKASSTAPRVQPKSAPPAKVPDSFRAQEFYNAAMTKRREGKPEDAAALLRESADLGDTSAMQELGECYRTGDGVPKQGLEAERWFLRASVAGDAVAMVSLGALYWLGDEDVPQNNDEAAKWFQRAADLNNPAGLYDLARFYEQGRGVPKSLDRAKQLYQQSAALGNAEAQRRLTQLQGKK